MVLVTGANGFLGKALSVELIGKGIGVKCAVRKPYRIKGAQVLQITDLDERIDWTECLAKVECVVHTAARVHIMNDRVSDPLAEFRNVNVGATLNLARQAVQSGVKRFVYISSVGVNGAETFSEPFSELSKPQPHSDYALSKFEAEKGLIDICAESDMEFVIIRPPLIYGSNAPGNFRSLLKFVHLGIPLPLGLLNNRRSMVALDNLVDFVKVCIEHPQARNQTFLVADGECVSTPQLIRLLSEGMGKTARLFPVPLQVLKLGAFLLGKQSMFQQLCGSLQVDITKAQNMLGWVPPMCMTDELLRAAKEFLNEKNI